MPRLTASTTPTDARRTARLLIAFLSGDHLALDVVLEETADDPNGAAGLLLGLAEMCSDLLVLIPDARQHLQTALHATLLADGGD